MTAPDDATRLYVSLGRVTRALRRAAAGSPVGHGALSALATLVTEGPMRLGELAVIEGVSPPSMTRIVATLESQGHLRRTSDPADGRASLVEATSSGRRLVITGREARITSLSQRLTALPDDQRKRLLDALPALEALSAQDGPGAT
ncbi:MAG TPA: MarR family transcriptional regulator [Nocardioidaceae bacterium]|nr:MarR family transcriptional regulator [Nocardioidaceae bacterium]